MATPQREEAAAPAASPWGAAGDTPAPPTDETMAALLERMMGATGVPDASQLGEMLARQRAAA